VEAVMKRIVYFVLLAALLTGCNTVRGIGEDVEAGGKAIQRTTR
jgi:entericidin B